MSTFFVNCDWGTTHFRLRAVRMPGVEIEAELRTDDGAARLAQDASDGERADRFRAVLTAGLRKLAASLRQPLGDAWVVISGMANSSIGWQPLPYASLPLGLDGSGLIWRELEPFDRDGHLHRVVLVSGACTKTDVMRGEETQTLGVFRLASASAARQRSLVILPGTHSKHLQVESGQIVGFQTFMTGELFDLLCHHSILRHSTGHAVAGPAPGLSGDSLRALHEGVDLAAGLPLSAALFRVRTRQLLDAAGADANRAFLSGLLIGCELGELRRAELGECALVLGAADELRESYLAALEHLGFSDRLSVISQADFERLSALGQAVLLRRLGGC